jgi:hypothetical protein
MKCSVHCSYKVWRQPAGEDVKVVACEGHDDGGSNGNGSGKRKRDEAGGGGGSGGEGRLTDEEVDRQQSGTAEDKVEEDLRNGMNAMETRGTTGETTSEEEEVNLNASGSSAAVRGGAAPSEEEETTGLRRRKIRRWAHNV